MTLRRVGEPSFYDQALIALDDGVDDTDHLGLIVRPQKRRARAGGFVIEQASRKRAALEAIAYAINGPISRNRFKSAIRRSRNRHWPPPF
jgi:hypothetical protein